MVWAASSAAVHAAVRFPRGTRRGVGGSAVGASCSRHGRPTPLIRVPRAIRREVARLDSVSSKPAVTRVSRLRGQLSAPHPIPSPRIRVCLLGAAVVMRLHSGAGWPHCPSRPQPPPTVAQAPPLPRGQDGGAGERPWPRCPDAGSRPPPRCPRVARLRASELDRPGGGPGHAGGGFLWGSLCYSSP